MKKMMGDQNRRIFLSSAFAASLSLSPLLEPVAHAQVPVITEQLSGSSATHSVMCTDQNNNSLRYYPIIPSESFSLTVTISGPGTLQGHFRVISHTDISQNPNHVPSLQVSVNSAERSSLPLSSVRVDHQINCVDVPANMSLPEGRTYADPEYFQINLDAGENSVAILGPTGLVPDDLVFVPTPISAPHQVNPSVAVHPTTVTQPQSHPTQTTQHAHSIRIAVPHTPEQPTVYLFPNLSTASVNLSFISSLDGASAELINIGASHIFELGLEGWGLQLHLGANYSHLGFVSSIHNDTFNAPEFMGGLGAYHSFGRDAILFEASAGVIYAPLSTNLAQESIASSNNTGLLLGANFSYLHLSSASHVTTNISAGYLHDSTMPFHLTANFLIPDSRVGIGGEFDLISNHQLNTTTLLTNSSVQPLAMIHASYLLGDVSLIAGLGLTFPIGFAGSFGAVFSW